MNRLNATTAMCRLAGLMTLAAMDCWEGETIVYRFQLPTCPDTTFRLADTIVASGLQFTVFPEHVPTCSGFTPYVVARVPGPLDIRFNRGSSCAFDVAYTYLIPPGAPEDRRRALEREKRQHSQTLISGILASTSVEARDLRSVEWRFESLKALRDWCATTDTVASASVRRQSDATNKLREYNQSGSGKR